MFNSKVRGIAITMFLLIALQLPTLNAQAPAPLIKGVDLVAITVSDMDRAVDFYSSVLTFRKVSDAEVSGEDYEHLAGVFGVRVRVVRMKLGDESIELDEYLAPKWTLDLMGKHSLDFWLTSEDLPDPNNRVTVNREGEIVLQYKPNNEEGHKRLIKKLERLMQQQTKCLVHGHECHEGLVARNLFLGQRIPLAGVAHQNGTVRFGDDPKTSALDRNCKAHELDNLYVVDASFFCSSGAVNPALTIIANALRVGDHLLERMGAERSDEKVMAAIA